MTKVELNVLFKKIQKDDKKEVLEFHILGDEIEYKTELMGMAGGIAVLGIGDIKFSAEFKSIQRDSKKITMKFEVKGDSDEKIVKLYPKAGYNVDLSLEASQMSLDEFYDGDGHEGIEYNVDGAGAVVVADGQLNMDEVDDIEVVSEGLSFTLEKSEEDDDLPFTVDVKEEDDDLLSAVEQTEKDDDLLV